MVCLLATCLVISPVIHESAHILALEFSGTPYITDLEIYPNTYGTIRMLSSAGMAETIIFVGIGIFTSILAGIFLLLVGRKKESPVSRISGVGLLLNPTLAMFSGSDLSTILSFFGLESLSIILGLFLGGFCLLELNRVATSLLSEAP
ncbi:MAG: hypothetical protein JW727_00150 [Candidatus Aenigmarchaeota archaeon]|nr:hypothetical protein [Candidatus Aenigmarchaeota archaeon]